MVKLPFKRASGRLDSSYIRNFIFGVEDSLVSTVGLLSGVAIGDVPERTIILAGVVLIFVEAFSMGTGSFLSETGAADYESQRRTSNSQPIVDSLIMFFSYFITGFIPLSPYMFAPTNVAFPLSITFSMVALFFLGLFSGRISKQNILWGGIKAFLIGGTAVLLGVIVGRLLRIG